MELDIRSLRRSDLDKGLLELLGQLTSLGNPSQEALEASVTVLIEDRSTQVLVAEDTARSRIVGTAKLLLERKLTRSCGTCGHIEDVVVDKECRGHKLGKRLIDALIRRARELDCYKIILDCAEENVAFYEKCGLARKEVQMALYL